MCFFLIYCSAQSVAFTVSAWLVLKSDGVKFASDVPWSDTQKCSGSPVILWFRLPGTPLLSLCQTKATAKCSSYVFETSSSDEANLAAVIFTQLPDLVVYASNDFCVKGAFDILLLYQTLAYDGVCLSCFWHRWDLGSSLNVRLKMDLCQPLLQAETQFFAFGCEEISTGSVVPSAWSCHHLMLLNAL